MDGVRVCRRQTRIAKPALREGAAPEIRPPKSDAHGFAGSYGPSSRSIASWMRRRMASSRDSSSTFSPAWSVT